MKTIALCTTLLAIGLLSAGCGSQKADQPPGVFPPPETSVAPADQTPEEPAVPPTPDRTEDSPPAMEGPALTEPADGLPDAEPAPEDAQSSAPPAEAGAAATPAGDQKILGPLGKSLLKAATGQTSGGSQPAPGDAPGYDKPE
jgi:hypothetical protein